MADDQQWSGADVSDKELSGPLYALWARVATKTVKGTLEGLDNGIAPEVSDGSE